jgi:hypothetical protein
VLQPVLTKSVTMVLYRGELSSPSRTVMCLSLYRLFHLMNVEDAGLHCSPLLFLGMMFHWLLHCPVTVVQSLTWKIA